MKKIYLRSDRELSLSLNLLWLSVTYPGINVLRTRIKFWRNSTVLFLILISSIKSDAQLASGMPHTFTVGASVAFAAPPPTITNVLPAGGLADESMNLITPAGWSFTFAGVVHNRVGVSTNGWAALIPTAWAGSPALPGPISANQLNNNTTGFPIIAPLWDDLSTSIISWIVPTATPNVLWIRWSCKWDKSNSSTVSLFYVKLDGNSNTITYYYPSFTYTPTSPSASIGIAGICPGDFYSVSPASATTATVDNVTENAAVGTGAANSFRPNNVGYTFTPNSPNDNCASATDLGTITATCANFTSSTFNATTSGSGMSCSPADVKDVWFKYTKPAGFASINVTTSAASCNSVTGTSVEVWSACGGTLLGCATTSVANPNYGQVTIGRPCASETFFVRVTSDGDAPDKFQICASGSSAVGPGTGITCLNAATICNLPFSQNGLTTTGSVNNYDSLSSACHTKYMNGEDFVFSYTPSVNQCINVSATTTGSKMGLFVFNGCPNTGGTSCLGSSEVPTGTASVNFISLTAGLTYYIVVDNDSSGGNQNNIPFDITVSVSLGQTPTITISGPNSFCTATSATYTAAITNGGTTPVYNWKKNGTTVGTNSPTLNISGLVVGNTISCVLTSNANCVSTTTANSNTITIVPNTAISITPHITNISCVGAKNGAINIDVAGGTGPYTICWDTLNTTNGNMFGVTVGVKTASNPLFGQGNPSAYVVNGIEANQLNLIRGITYSFNVVGSSGHPFLISTSSIGGTTTGIVTNGQTGAPTVGSGGTVTFRPNSTHPSTLFYVCANHQFMGYAVHVQDGYCVEDLTNLRSGIYNVTVTDATGCTASAQYTVNELPSPVVLSAAISNENCGQHDGAIDLTVSGGAGPYTVCWDVTNKTTGPVFGVTVGAKTASNPYFNQGNSFCYFINGVEARLMTLVRGIPYTFNIFSPAHPWHVSTDNVGGNSNNIVQSGQTGAPNENGTVIYRPASSAPSLLRYVCSNHQFMGYNINIVNPTCTQDLSGLSSGMYTVIATDANGCTATATYNVNTNASLSLSAGGSTDATCFGGADGTIDLIPSGGSSPYSATGTGPTFTVMVEPKNHSHPQYGLGARPEGFTLDGVQGKELTLIRGITYSFSVFAPGHAFFISTDVAAGNSSSQVLDGVTNSLIDIGTLTFTPNSNHPNLLYYQCGFHDYMGWKINIVDQLPNGDLGNCMAGNYHLSIKDAFGCVSSPVNLVVSEPPSTTYYYDADGDNYGTDNETALGGCFVPPAFALFSGDCQVEDPAINPGAPEVCNGIDDNCNNLVDGDDSTLTNAELYADNDNDGFGDPASVIQSCTEVSGYIGNNLDCDDTNNLIHPGGTEICNGLDDDCNGLADDGLSCGGTNLTVTVFIQGYYSGGLQMIAVADPINHPAICDSITVELASPNPPYAELYSVKGTISVSGSGIFQFPSNAAGSNYYIVIHHRNSIETWSASPVMLNNNILYDFSSSVSMAFGNNLVNLGLGVYGLWSGDVNQDGNVDDQDYDEVENGSQLFLTGYISDDITGDRILESADYALIENNFYLNLMVFHP